MKIITLNALKKFKVKITEVINAVVNAEAAARNSAITTAVSAEATARNSAITTAINNLDVGKIGSDATYIKYLSQTDGKVSASYGTMPTFRYENNVLYITG